MKLLCSEKERSDVSLTGFLEDEDVVVEDFLPASKVVSLVAMTGVWGEGCCATATTSPLEHETEQ